MLVRLVTCPANLVILTAAAFLLADAAIVYIGTRGDFAFDFTCCYQQAGQRLLDDGSRLYEWSPSYTFRYSPWAAVAFTPLVALTEGQAIVAWLLVKIGLVGAIAVWLARPFTGRGRWLVAGAVLLFPPVWHDLVLGNVSVFTVAVLLALLRWPAGPGGALFGLLLLLAPKPHLVPIAIWLSVRSPRAALSAVGVGVGGGLIGLAVFGIQPWIDYLATFADPVGREFTANIGFSGLLGPAGVVVGVVAAIVVLGLAVTRRDGSGLGLSIASGVLLGPYTFIHYLSGLVVAALPLLRSRPRLLAPFPWLLLLFPLIPVWIAAFAALLWRAPPTPEEPAGRPAAPRD